MLAEQDTGNRIHPDQLAAKCREIQIGLKDLGLAPLILQTAGFDGLDDLLHDAPSLRTALKALLRQTQLLPAERRCTPVPLMRQRVPGRSRNCAPIDAPMRVKP